METVEKKNWEQGWNGFELLGKVYMYMHVQCGSKEPTAGFAKPELQELAGG